MATVNNINQKSRETGTLYQNQIDITNKNSSQTIIYDFISYRSCVLDVGCACGDLGIVLNKNKKCTVYGMEFDIKSIQIALKTNSYENIWQCDLETLEINDFIDFFNYFDFIIFGDILEHLQRPNDIINKFTKLLKSNGKFIISLPNLSHGSIKAQIINNNFIYTPAGTLDETHLRFFTYKTIPAFLAKNNLQINELKCTFLPLNGFYDYTIYDDLDIKTLTKIINDIHSYILQYVFTASKSEFISKQEIIDNNYMFLSLPNYHSEYLINLRTKYQRRLRFSPKHIFKIPAQVYIFFQKNKIKNLFTLYDFQLIYVEIEKRLKNKNWFMKNIVLYPLQIWGKLIER